MPIPIIYEDPYLLAVNKPAGIAAVPGPHIKHHVIELLNRPGTFVLHRLDLKTPGVLLVGKQQKYRKQLEAILTDAHTKKTYVALVRGVMEKEHGVIKIKLPPRESGRRQKGGPARRSFREGGVRRVYNRNIYRDWLNKKPVLVDAITEYTTLKTFENVSLVAAMIKTGRYHQIRLHFAKIGHPVVNDDEHGDAGWNKKFRRKHPSQQMFLQAASLEFNHPLLQKRILVKAPLPENLQHVLDKLNVP